MVGTEDTFAVDFGLDQDFVGKECREGRVMVDLVLFTSRQCQQCLLLLWLVRETIYL